MIFWAFMSAFSKLMFKFSSLLSISNPRSLKLSTHFTSRSGHILFPGLKNLPYGITFVLSKFAAKPDFFVKFFYIYRKDDINAKAEYFQNILMEKFYQIFPVKELKVCKEDKPWFTKELKNLDRKRKREFSKNKKSKKWESLNADFVEKVKKEKDKYRVNIVEDLKSSDPRKWYSKIKRMSGQDKEQTSIFLEEFSGLTDSQQAEKIVDFYSSTRNNFQPLTNNDFPSFTNDFKKNDVSDILISPEIIQLTIKGLNKKSACVEGDLPIKIIAEHSQEISAPLCHIINSMFMEGVYPTIWKVEHITPVPKQFPPVTIKHLRPISGLFNFAKIADKIVAGYITNDMSATRDKTQYGNEKGLSVNHYLVKMLHKILTSVDKNSQNEKYAVILTMLDWSQAFERQSHVQGIQSFIDNGVRKSLIPFLISFFQGRQLRVKWNKTFSTPRAITGGSPQGGTAGILEYISQTKGNLGFLEDDEVYKFIDDASFLEVLNLVSIGLSSYHSKMQVPSDLSPEDLYLPPQNIQTQSHLNQISKWTDDHEMLLNSAKTKYMLINFCHSAQFQTRLFIKNTLLEQVRETKLLGVIISDDLSWHSNTKYLVSKAYKRMTILRNLYEFNVPRDDMIKIYILFIRSVVEQSSVIWSSSLTKEDEASLERTQKCALRLIYKHDYISYRNALQISKLPTLSQRRSILLKSFASGCIKNNKTCDMFPTNSDRGKTRLKEKYFVPFCHTERLATSAMLSMARSLNDLHNT